MVVSVVRRSRCCTASSVSLLIDSSCCFSRKAFPLLYRQFCELVDTITQMVTDHHSLMLFSVVLQDAESHHWNDSKEFYEVRHLYISLTIFVWSFDTFENNLEVKHKFTKYLKESCGLEFNQHFSFKYFPKIPFVNEISPKSLGGFGRCRHE